jgi:hypothetical protein
MVKQQDKMQTIGMARHFLSYLGAPRSGRECRDQQGDPILCRLSARPPAAWRRGGLRGRRFGMILGLFSTAFTNMHELSCSSVAAGLDLGCSGTPPALARAGRGSGPLPDLGSAGHAPSGPARPAGELDGVDNRGAARVAVDVDVDVDVGVIRPRPPFPAGNR